MSVHSHSHCVDGVPDLQNMTDTKLLLYFRLQCFSTTRRIWIHFTLDQLVLISLWGRTAYILLDLDSHHMDQFVLFVLLVLLESCLTISGATSFNRVTEKTKKWTLPMMILILTQLKKNRKSVATSPNN